MSRTQIPLHTTESSQKVCFFFASDYVYIETVHLNHVPDSQWTRWCQCSALSFPQHWRSKHWGHCVKGTLFCPVFLFYYNKKMMIHDTALSCVLTDQPQKPQAASRLSWIIKNASPRGGSGGTETSKQKHHCISNGVTNTNTHMPSLK